MDELDSPRWASLLLSFPRSVSNADRPCFSHLDLGHPKEVFVLSSLGPTPGLGLALGVWGVLINSYPRAYNESGWMERSSSRGEARMERQSLGGQIHERPPAMRIHRKIMVQLETDSTILHMTLQHGWTP